ncbi:MAG: YbhB/YbcL family Raf kinase inhibitor-like protein [Candidatus Woesearchaeota archaeon]
MFKKYLSLVIILILVSSCKPNLDTKGGKMEIKSSVFINEDFIPKKYTCDGLNISPPLEFSNIPSNTKSIALICDDPDAPMGVWIHWVLFDLPIIKKLSENIPRDKILNNGAKHGINSGKRIGYDGPCPPSGTHRYFFKVYALDTKLNLEPGITKEQLINAMEGHILAQGQLMGKYTR